MLSRPGHSVLTCPSPRLTRRGRRAPARHYGVPNLVQYTFSTEHFRPSSSSASLTTYSIKRKKRHHLQNYPSPPLTMAEDTQQTDASQQSSLPINKETLTVHPENKPFTGAQWQWQNGQVRPYQPPENANLMPGGTQHTAGGKDLEVSLRNAFPKGLSWSDFVELPKRPCVRDALLQGIGAGFAAGGLRALWRGNSASE